MSVSYIFVLCLTVYCVGCPFVLPLKHTKWEAVAPFEALMSSL